MANNHKNVIELNGKLYDTKHGGLVEDVVVSSGKIKNQTIDGFVAPKPQTVINPTKAQIFTPKTPKPIKYRQTGGHHIRHSQQKSVTLIRKSVKRPKTTEKAPDIAPFHNKSRLHVRSDRASNTSKSPFINKYGNNSHGITKRTEPIAVVAPPQHKQSIAHKTEHHPPKPVKAHVEPSKSEKLFTDALQKINPSVKQKPKKQSKAIKWSSGLAATLLLVGFIAYLNFPNLNVKLAGTQAGFSANMPGYKPSGYSFNSTNQEAGKVTINFKSNTDNRSYAVKQEVSNWNSQSLQENFLMSNDKIFTTTQEGGRTVYMYDNGSATWVNGGVWYLVESNSLSSDQVLNIVASI